MSKNGNLSLFFMSMEEHGVLLVATWFPSEISGFVPLFKTMPLNGLITKLPFEGVCEKYLMNRKKCVHV